METTMPLLYVPVLAALQPVKLIVALLLLVGAGLFFHFLSIKTKQGIRSLLKPAILIFLAGTLLFCNGYYNPDAPTNPVTLLLRAAISSVEMFISETHLDEILLEKPGFLESSRGEWYLICFFGLYVAALMITFWAIVDLVGTGLRGRLQLFFRRSRPVTRKSYIFIGINEPSLALASDILANQPDAEPADIIFIDAAEEKKRRREISFSAFFHGEISGAAGKDAVLHTLGPGCLVLECRQTLQDTHANTIPALCKELGFSGLKPWLISPNTDIFLLFEDDQDNFRRLASLVSAGVSYPTLFCRLREDGISAKYVTFAASDNIKFLSLSSLSVQDLMTSSNGKLQPVNFVDIASDSDGRPLGYVSSDFNAMIVGFDEIGKAVLEYLYEFGSFVNGAGELNPSRLYVIDKRAEAVSGPYFSLKPGLSVRSGSNPGGRIVLECSDIQERRFWDNLGERIDSLNYVVVSLEDTDACIQAGADILTYAYANRRNGLHNFVVVVYIRESTPLQDELISRYTEDRNYGQHLYVFGREKVVWSYSFVSEAAADERAKIFYTKYLQASSDDPEVDGESSWDNRHATLREAVRKHDLALIEKITVQEFEDRHNYYHARTKKALGGKEPGQFISRIPAQYNGTHYTAPGNGPERSILEYLAIGEHLRWMCSYETRGYQVCLPGEKRDYLRKRHNYMIPYADLSEEIKHYDWITVKTTYLLDDKR